MTRPMLARRRLGQTNLYVTPLGLGGAWLGCTLDGPNERLAVATVLRALELGINLIDTSPVYIEGESQRFIGTALEAWYKRGGHREDIVLSTKIGKYSNARDYTAEGTRRSVEKSLELLKTDYLDVVLVHDPDDLMPVLTPGGALEALKELKSQGVIRAIGLGVRKHEFHRYCIQTGEFDVSLTYRDLNLLDQSAVEGVLETAAAYDVGVFNGMPIIKGLLSGRDPLEVARELGEIAHLVPPVYHHQASEVQRARALWEWAQSRNISLLALNLQFCQREPRIASTLVGASQPSEIEADVAALSDTIPGEIWRELHEQFRP